MRRDRDREPDYEIGYGKPPIDTRPVPRYVRLKAPAGIGAVQTLSNRHITIAEDRIVEMSAEDAACLIPDGWIMLGEAE
jgi:hypothetical protein